MGFVELGNDMRLLASWALKLDDCTIPQDWLEDIRGKAATHARRVASVRSEYHARSLRVDDLGFSERELEIIHGLMRGLTRSEIAKEYGVSSTNLKLTLNIICEKLGVDNTMDAVRMITALHILDP
jgi:DNA-binding NarL/FixJ family response regulator